MSAYPLLESCLPFLALPFLGLLILFGPAMLAGKGVGLCLLPGAGRLQVAELFFLGGKALSLLPRLAQGGLGSASGLGGLVECLLGLRPSGLCRLLLGRNGVPRFHGLGVSRFQGGDLAGQGGLAGKGMAPRGNQPAPLAVGPQISERLPLRVGCLLPCQTIAVGRVPPVILLVPAALGLERFRLGLQVSECLLGGSGSAFQLTASLGVGGSVVGQLRFQSIHGLPGLAGTAVGGHGDRRVLGGAGKALQQVAALIVIGLEEGGELALGEQHGAGELVEGEPQALWQQAVELALLGSEQPVVFEVAQ